MSDSEKAPTTSIKDFGTVRFLSTNAATLFTASLSVTLLIHFLIMPINFASIGQELLVMFQAGIVTFRSLLSLSSSSTATSQHPARICMRWGLRSEVQTVMSSVYVGYSCFLAKAKTIARHTTNCLYILFMLQDVQKLIKKLAVLQIIKHLHSKRLSGDSDILSIILKYDEIIRQKNQTRLCILDLNLNLQFQHMGKRGKRQNKSNDKQPPVKQQDRQGVWRDHKQILENTYFRKYYQTQFQQYFKNDPSEFDVFWSHMKLRLPVVFRVNPNQPNYFSFVRKLMHEDMVKEEKFEGQFQPQEEVKVEKIEWFPKQLVYRINTNRQQFKKSKKLEQLYSFLQKATDSGLVTRQELVSMLPPLFLDVQPTDIVLDMCAAPGSKTSQMLEMLYGERKSLSSGCVVANDVDYSRAQMLIHQVNRSGTAGMVVINHNGQFLPQIYDQNKDKILFDKILADVPCSGDGATRKLPNKWSDWHSNDGGVLHPLQLNILMRGISLLKEQGELVYSTCSLNPIEDEAVILELMRRVKSGLQVVDIHNRGIPGRRGLTHWLIMESKGKEIKVEDTKSETDNLFNIYKSFDSNTPKKIKESFFPESQEQMIEYGIQNTMRVLPHDMNSGGFFVALLKKTKGFAWKFEGTQEKVKGSEEKAQKEEKELEAQMQKVQQNLPVQDEEVKEVKEIKESVQKKDMIQQEVEQQLVSEVKKNNRPPREFKRKEKKVEEYIQMELEEFKIVQEFYGIDESIKNLLFVKKNQDTRRKVTIVSSGVANFINADKKQKLKLINMGCRAFEKGKQSFAGSMCLYRLCQDSILFLLPLITKRKIRIGLDLFKLLIKDITIKHEQIVDESVKSQANTLSQGSFVLYIDETILGKHVVDALVAQNFKSVMNVMVSKEDLQSLRIRYL